VCVMSITKKRTANKYEIESLDGYFSFCLSVKRKKYFYNKNLNVSFYSQ
jgi:hypothetical protein